VHKKAFKVLQKKGGLNDYANRPKSQKQQRYGPSKMAFGGNSNSNTALTTHEMKVYNDPS